MKQIFDSLFPPVMMYIWVNQFLKQEKM